MLTNISNVIGGAKMHCFFCQMTKCVDIKTGEKSQLHKMFSSPLLHPSAKLWIEDRQQIDKTHVVNTMKRMYTLAHDMANICGTDGEFVFEEQTLGLVAKKKKVRNLIMCNTL